MIRHFLTGSGLFKARCRPETRLPGRTGYRIFSLAILVTLASGAGAEQALNITAVWARESPPTVTNGAVYMNINDMTGKGDRLIGVATPIAAKAELHEHTMDAASDKEHDSADANKAGDHSNHGKKTHDGHKEMKTQGMMKMRQVQAIDIPAGGSVELKPMGLHVMLFDLKDPLKNEDTFEMSLEFENAGTVPVLVTVKKPNS